MPDIPGTGPAPESITFYSASTSELAAGDYSITVTQSVSWQGPPPDAATVFSYEQEFSVAAPRFALAPDDIYAVFPPANGEGDFEGVLPHVVLARRGLPWSRTLGRTLPEPPDGLAYPWLALLLFEEDELLSPSPAPSGLPEPPVSPERSTTYRAAQFLHPAGDPRVLRPTLDHEDLDRPDDLCQAIEVSRQTFLDLVPRLAELPYLAHVRQVRRPADPTEPAAAEAEDWFAVVLANRLPAAGRNIAHLVSLEGLADFLDESKAAQVTKFERVRLVSLAAWSFVARGGEGDFMQLAGRVAANSDVLRLPVARPPDADGEPTLASNIALDACRRGYLPINYTLRTGEDTAAWYRGPLAPVRSAPAGRPWLHSVEAAMVYDPATGLFDLSYAAAWQLGRLLALADRALALSLLDWRVTMAGALSQAAERAGQIRSFQSVLAFPGRPADRLQAQVQTLVRDYLAGDLNQMVRTLAAPPAGAAAPRPFVPAADASGLAAQLDRMPGLQVLSLQAAAGARAAAAGAAVAQPMQGLLDGLAGVLRAGRDPTQVLLEE